MLAIPKLDESPTSNQALNLITTIPTMTLASHPGRTRQAISLIVNKSVKTVRIGEDEDNGR